MKTLDARLDPIIEALLKFARHDFSARAPVSDELDHIDAIATGLNMMAETLDGEVASRAELEKAHRDLKATQTRMLHAAKLSAAGQLAGGIAHEINNPVGWVSLSAGIALRRIAEIRAAVEPNEGETIDTTKIVAAANEVETLLQQMMEGIERIRVVVGDLRRFSGVDGEEETLVALNDVVRATCSLAEPSTRGRAVFKLVLGDIPLVMGSRGRFSQVVTNLVLNAAQAIESQKRNGEIIVRTSVRDDRVVLVVEDDGPGIPEELREKIFDAFYTTTATKPGLGLVVVKEIVTRYSGDVRLATSAAGGLRVEVTFPIAELGTPV